MFLYNFDDTIYNIYMFIYFLTGDTIFEFLLNVEAAISFRWLHRKRFIEELHKLASVVEYDAVDFSFIAIAVRIQKGKLITVCSVEFKLTPSFPTVLPLIAIHDLQNTFSFPLESSSISHDLSWSIERLTKEVFLAAYSTINQQAFEDCP